MSKKEVFQVNVPLTPPRGTRKATWCYGFYTVEDNVLTMTDQEGNPAVDGDGNGYTAELKPNDNPYLIAGSLTRKLRLALKPKGGGPSNFNSPIDYGPSSVA